MKFIWDFKKQRYFNESYVGFKEPLTLRYNSINKKIEILSLPFHVEKANEILKELERGYGRDNVQLEWIVYWTFQKHFPTNLENPFELFNVM